MGANEMRRNFKRVIQSEKFSVCDGLSVRVRRAVCIEFRIVPRQFFCMSRGVHILSGTYH